MVGTFADGEKDGRGETEGVEGVGGNNGGGVVAGGKLGTEGTGNNVGEEFGGRVGARIFREDAFLRSKTNGRTMATIVSIVMIISNPTIMRKRLRARFDSPEPGPSTSSLIIIYRKKKRKIESLFLGAH